MYIDPRTKLKAQEMDKIKEYEKKKKEGALMHLF